MPELLLFGEEVKRTATPILKALVKYRTDHINVLPLNPSDKACKFCKVSGTCPALKGFVDKTMAEGFEAEQTPGEPVLLDPIKLGHAMDSIDLVETWMKGVQATVEIELLAGRPVIGKDGPYKLVQGKKGNRKWKDEKEAEELFKSFRLKVEEMYDLKLISPTTAEKLLAKPHPRQWEKAKALYDQAEGGKHVANALDSRPAIEQKPLEAGFEAEPEVIDDGSDLF
jgi:hypothetical protein